VAESESAATETLAVAAARVEAGSDFEHLAGCVARAVGALGFDPVALPARDFNDEDYDHDHLLWARRLDAPRAIQSVSLHTRQHRRGRCLVHLNIWFKLTRLYESLSQFAPGEFPPERRDLVPDHPSVVFVRLNMDTWMPFAQQPLDPGFSQRPDLNFKIRPGRGREQRIEKFTAMLDLQLVPVLERHWTEIELADLGWRTRGCYRWALEKRWQLLAYLHAGQVEQCLTLIRAHPHCLGETGERRNAAMAWFEAWSN
jgi:hypothetical protein